MKPLKLVLNNRIVETHIHPGTTLLDFIRNEKCIKGTKEACREGECGACTVLVSENDGESLKYKTAASCILPLGNVQNRHVVTIEGLNLQVELNPIQQAIVDHGATQCGFCTPGFILSLTGFFLNSESLSYEDAIDAMDGNICRCTGYVSIQQAAKFLSDKYSARSDSNNDRMKQLVQWKILPDYFNDIQSMIKKLNSESPIDSAWDKKGITVAGGTDLYIQKPEELIEHDLNFISNRKDLSEIKLEGKDISIGGSATVEQLRKSEACREAFPELDKYLNMISSTILRNSATVAGNIVNASPIGDLSIMLLPLNCTLQKSNGKKNKEVLLKDFFRGYKDIDLKKDEIIEWIKFTPLDKNDIYNFEKVSRRKYLDIASVNSAFYAKIKDDSILEVNISAGGVAPVPFLLKKTSEFLTGKEVNIENVKEAASIAMDEVSPISDIRGGEAYKRLLLRQLIYSHFIKLFPEKIKFEGLQ